MGGPTTSLWPRLAGLPLVVEAYELERLEVPPEVGVERVTTVIHLRGGGLDGAGEDVGLTAEQEAFVAAGPVLPLAGEWTLESFCTHLATLDQWPEPPHWEPTRRWRNWAFEAAALDLALRQSGRALHEALDLEPRPLRFVNSLGLGKPASIDTIHRRLGNHPGLRFKLDVEPGWSLELMGELRATGAVDTIDFKGRYGLEVEDGDALVPMYERVLQSFPEAVLEDPHDEAEITALLASHRDRVSFDAPIHTVEDFAALPLQPGFVNVKPCRVGSLRDLMELYAHCNRAGLHMYGGGMGELGPGRGQIQLLAALFHPDAPNDVAPSGFNAPEPSADLPGSPLDPRPDATGFRRTV
jgi:L-alanine-DL-glutamate epimerase-like enolase superfamily enzyme